MTKSLERLADSIENSDCAGIRKELNKLFEEKSVFFKRNDKMHCILEDADRIMMAKAAFNAMGVLLTSPTKLTRQFVQKLTLNILKETQSRGSGQEALEQAVNTYLASVEPPTYYESLSPTMTLGRDLKAIQNLTVAASSISSQ